MEWLGLISSGVLYAAIGAVVIIALLVAGLVVYTIKKKAKLKILNMVDVDAENELEVTQQIK